MKGAVSFIRSRYDFFLKKRSKDDGTDREQEKHLGRLGVDKDSKVSGETARSQKISEGVRPSRNYVLATAFSPISA